VIGEDIVVFASVYDTASEGRSKETEVNALDIETGKKVWSLQRDELTEGSVEVASTIHNGIVGIVIDTGRVYDVDASDGTVLWEAETSHRRDPNRGGNDIPTPIVFGDQFVLCSEEVQAFNVETGERNWTVGSRLPEIRTIPPVIDGTVYYPTANDSGEYGGILGVTVDGEITTEVEIPTSFETLPAVGREQQYYISHSDATLRKYKNN
jgi:outer membrane protein assembly factor BamB